MNKIFLVPILILWMLKETSAQSNHAFEKINSVRDGIYFKLQNHRISKEKALLVYKKLQDSLFNKKDYPNYIQVFLYEAVDFYVPNDDYEYATQSISKGLKALQYVKGSCYDTLFFQLNCEIAEYYRRMPNKINLAEKYFKSGYDFLLKKKWLQQKMPAFVITFLSNYGRLVDDLGDSEQSFNYFQQARQLAKQQKTSLNQYAVLSNLAKYYREKKDYQNALKLLKEALPLAESDDKTSVVHLAIGRCYQQMKQPTETLKAIAEAEKFYRKAHESQPRQWINIQTLKAETYFSLNQVAIAEKIFKETLIDFNKKFHHKKGIQVARIENGLSEVFEKKGNYRDALKHCQNALIAADTTHEKTKFIFENVIAPQEYFIALNQKAELLAIANPTESAQTYLLAIGFATRLRKSFDMPESKLFYSEKVYPIYEKTLESVYHLWVTTKSNFWVEKFFYVLEASKSATLGDAVKDHKIRPKALNDSLLEEESSLRQRIVKLQIKLLESGNEKTLADLSEAKVRLNHLINNIEIQSKKYYKLKYDEQQISLRETQQKLSNQTIFISYFLGENTLFYLAINKEKYDIIRLENVENIKKTINNLYQSINTPPGIDAYKGHELAHQAYKVLLFPIEKMLLNSNKIIVSRHEIIGFLPFEVLESQGKSDYLVYKFTISYANSASLHFDSTISGQNTDIIAYAPFSNGSETGRFRDKGFKALPASINEIGAINGEILQDNQATKINFQESYRNKGIIHFATHAQVDDENPSKSFIALFPEGNDFKLYTPELYNLSLENTQLVVLSACETGKGKIKKGEGIISLARAFQFAGCPSVITTIWNAHDESMAKLSERFYAHLKQGYSTAEAIQLSKIELIRSYSDHPFYWSNFILIGKSSPIILRSNTILYFVLILVFLLSAAAFLFRKRIITLFSK
jgi:CHAT domain-containing protein/predicted negative regulator of RcsB-dependent stress response